MSAVDVLAVMDGLVKDAGKRKSKSVTGRALLIREAARLHEARAAVAELIEASHAIVNKHDIYMSAIEPAHCRFLHALARAQGGES